MIRRGGRAGRPRPRIVVRSARWSIGVGALTAVLTSTPARVLGQEADSTRVPLSLLYQGIHRPTLVVAPFTAEPGAESAATQAEVIVARDLDYSDRFQMSVTVPPALLTMPELDYTLWDRVGVDYVVRGSVERDEEGIALYLEVHDIVYGRLLGVRRYAFPTPGAPGFRMALHEASDAVVEHVFDEPGMAATRIAFSMRPQGSDSKDLFIVDSDGENLRRVSRHDLSILSPSWHPEGDRIVFLSLTLAGDAGIYEVDLRTGREQRLPSLGDGQVNTPTYLPGGERVAVVLDRAVRSRIVSYDLERGCCVTVLNESRSQDLSPAFSPDGQWMAFTSNRLGAPLVFMRSMEGGDATLVAPHVPGQPADFTSPEWSPRDEVLAYHGSLGRGQRYQIVLTDLRDGTPRTIRLTDEGNNESPSWAPDGRHLVFVGERADGTGLYVMDIATGRTRRLVAGRQVSTPAWSPSLSGDR